MKNLISILDVSITELNRLMADAARLKAERIEGCCHPLLAVQDLAIAGVAISAGSPAVELEFL